MCYSVFYMFVHFYPPISPSKHPQLKLLLPFPAVHLFRYLKLIQCHSKFNNPPRSKKHATHPQVIWVQSYKLRKYFFFCLGSFEITRLHFSPLYWRSNIVAMLKRLFKDTCLLLLLLMIFATIRCPEFISQNRGSNVSTSMIDREFCPILAPSPKLSRADLLYNPPQFPNFFLSVDNE